MMETYLKILNLYIKLDGDKYTIDKVGVLYTIDKMYDNWSDEQTQVIRDIVIPGDLRELVDNQVIVSYSKIDSGVFDYEMIFEHLDLAINYMSEKSLIDKNFDILKNDLQNIHIVSGENKYSLSDIRDNKAYTEVVNALEYQINNLDLMLSIMK